MTIFYFTIVQFVSKTTKNSHIMSVMNIINKFICVSSIKIVIPLSNEANRSTPKRTSRHLDLMTLHVALKMSIGSDCEVRSAIRARAVACRMPLLPKHHSGHTDIPLNTVRYATP